MTDPPDSRSRPSIAERAAKRDRLSHEGSDRYSSLVRALQDGREVPDRPTRAMPLTWHPVLWTMLRLALVAGSLYLIALFGWNWWRDQQVDTWSGPDASVQSGQRLEGCLAAGQSHDDLLPSWVRYEGSVYVLTDARWALGHRSRPGETSLVETGYSLAQKRILLTDEPAAGTAPTSLVVALPPADGGALYLPHPECV